MPEPFQPHRIQKPVAGPTIPESLLPGENRPPLSSSTVFVTDTTRQQLQLVGWQDGDPIPPDLGAKLQQIRQKMLEEESRTELKDTALAANWKAVTPKFTDISSLPPDKQEEVRAYLRNYKELMALQNQQNEEQQRIDSQIPASIQGQAREELRKQLIESERARRELEQQWTAQEAAEASPAPPPEATPPTPPPEATSPTPPPAATVPDDPAAPAAASPPATCAYCGWPQDKPASVEITQLDKENYVVAMLAQKRFEKVYSLLGGKMQVRFRALTTQETHIIDRQMAAMVRSGEVAGDGEYWLNRMEFELAACIQAIVVQQTVIYDAAPVAEFPRPEGMIQPTVLPAMRDHLFANGLTQDTTRRIVFRKFREFMSLLGRLEALVDSENF